MNFDLNLSTPDWIEDFVLSAKLLTESFAALTFEVTAFAAFVPRFLTLATPDLTDETAAFLAETSLLLILEAALLSLSI